MGQACDNRGNYFFSILVFTKKFKTCGYLWFRCVDQCFLKLIALKKLLLTLIMGVSAITLVESCKHEIPGQLDAVGNTAGENTYTPPALACNTDTPYFQKQLFPVFISNKIMNQYRRTKQLICVSFVTIISTIN
jgi:hypothetical protein